MKLLRYFAVVGAIVTAHSAFAKECKNLRYWGCFCHDTENKNPPPHEFTQLPGMDTTFCADGLNDLEFKKALDDYSVKCSEAAKGKPNLSQCNTSGRARTKAECDANPFPGCTADMPQNPPKIIIATPPDGRTTR